MPFPRTRRVIVAALTYLVIIAVTLAVLDVALQVLGLFPPRMDPGDRQLGWRPARATGAPAIGKCTEFSTGELVSYTRNEDGIRTSLSRADTAAPEDGVRIGVTGDSHTDLCAPNAQVHSGVLETELRRAGIAATVLNYGSGRYSPLQDLLAFEYVLKPYHPQVLVMNVYTGNDFYDLLRHDDRPHLRREGDDYRIADPVWYTLDDPSTRRRSPTLGVLRTLGDRTGVRPLMQRISYLRDVGGEFGGGIGDQLAYLRDLSKGRESSIGYADALTAQMLNQQIFFHHFPGSLEESIERARSVMRRARRENPDIVLVMSPIPSYQLVGETPIDSAMLRTFSRLPFTLATSVARELQLYEALRSAATEDGWVFADNLAALKAAGPGPRLYNDFDYHLTPRASEIVGREQQTRLLPVLTASRKSPSVRSR